MLLHVGFSVVLILSNVVVSIAQSSIKTLPGFPGDLPFKLETGYIGVGELEDVQLFYYFIESEGSPENDPLLLWLTGGPGCSAFSGFVYEIGPLNFNFTDSREGGGLPTFSLNPYSWTKVANIIFLDAPVGTGFSYSTTFEGYIVDDKLSVALNYEFLRKWLLNHPQFLKNQLYISGDSYSGIIVPMLAYEISQGNEVRLEPQMNLQGYILGNPLIDTHTYLNSRIPYAHKMALLSDSLFESTRTSCNGEYVNIDPSNAECVKNMELVNTCIDKIYLGQILEPVCPDLSSLKPHGPKWNTLFFEDNSLDFLVSMPQLSHSWCRSYNYILSYRWANDKTVQHALHVREGTIKEWVRCNEALPYTKDVQNVLYYYQNLINKGYRILIYSGDHDMSVSYIDTQSWIMSLNLTIENDWKPWSVDGQIAGYTMKYSSKKSYMTFATVKGGGHTAPEYKPKECYAMIYRWLAYYPL